MKNPFRRKEAAPEIFYCAFCEREFRRVELDGYKRSNLNVTLGLIPHHIAKLAAGEEYDEDESAAIFLTKVIKAMDLEVERQTYVWCPGEGSEPQKRK